MEHAYCFQIFSEHLVISGIYNNMIYSNIYIYGNKHI